MILNVAFVEGVDEAKISWALTELRKLDASEAESSREKIIYTSPDPPQHTHHGKQVTYTSPNDHPDALGEVLKL